VVDALEPRPERSVAERGVAKPETSSRAPRLARSAFLERRRGDVEWTPREGRGFALVYAPDAVVEKTARGRRAGSKQYRVGRGQVALGARPGPARVPRASRAASGRCARVLRERRAAAPEGARAGLARGRSWATTRQASALHELVAGRPR
jgi:hypothetical protein